MCDIFLIITVRVYMCEWNFVYFNLIKGTDKVSAEPTVDDDINLRVSHVTRFVYIKKKTTKLSEFIFDT